MGTDLSRFRQDPEAFAAAWTPLFGELSREARYGISRRVEWIEIEGGSCLMREGEEGDSAYILVSGRLQVVRRAEGGEERLVGEVSRGESVGEMALMTGERRNASIYAARDSILARLSRSAFEELTREHPELLLNLSRLVIRRLERQRLSPGGVPPVRNVAVVYHDEKARASGFLDRMAGTLGRFGATLRLDSAVVAAAARAAGFEPRGASMAAWLDEQERANRFIVYGADASVTEWTRRSIRQADRVLIVASAEGDPAPREVEAVLCSSDSAIGRSALDLVLLHDDGVRPPGGTRRWLDARRVERHHHVRLDRDGDLERLGRFLDGRAVGIVLAGGGAKGFAHIGVVGALREAGFPLDLAGGTSLGAVVAAGVATDWDHERFVSDHREAFTRGNPLNDWNALPLVSLFRGGKMERMLRRYLGEGDIEDLWLPFFCVSSNMTKARMTVHRRGALWKAIRASLSLPGVIPPVVFGDDLHIDGGTFDNLPVDAARDLGAGRVVASNLGFQKNYRLEYDEVPTTWQLLRDRYVTRRRRYKVPSMVNTLFRATVLGGQDRAREVGGRADLYLESPVHGIGLLDWQAFDRAVEIGRSHALERLREQDLHPDAWIGPGDGP